MSVLNFACVCGGGIGNLGVPSCVKNPSLLSRDIFQNTYAADGTRNSIKATDLVDGVLPESYMLAMLNHEDPTKRWYITPASYEEVATSRTDRQTQESSTGTIISLRNGVKVIEAELWVVSEPWTAAINKGNCVEVSRYALGEGGELSGNVSDDGSEFFPASIQKGTLVAEAFDANADKNAYVKVSYQLSRNNKPESYITLSLADLGADLRDSRSLIEVALVQDSDNANTATEVFVDALNCSGGSYGDPLKLIGATTTAEWTVAGVAPSAVEEVTPGTYKLTIASTPSTAVIVDYTTQRAAITDFGYDAEPVTVTTGA